MVSLHIGGGGIRASFVAQCLDDLFNVHPSVSQDLNVATGVSAGSIVASCIATDTSLSDTLHYLNTKSFVPKKNVCGSAYTLYKMWNNAENSFYGNERLSSAIHDLFESKKCRINLRIAVAEASTFRPVSHLVKKNESIVPSLVTASCSIPGLFSPVRVGSKYYIDAGTVQELDNSSIAKYLQKPNTKLHILCSCHPWNCINDMSDEPYNPDFQMMAKRLASMLWDTGVREAHYNNLSSVLGINEFKDGRSLLCMKRIHSGFKCLGVIHPFENKKDLLENADFYVLLFAPTMSEYDGFERATLIDPPSVRKPVIKHILSKCKTPSLELIQLVEATGLYECSRKLSY